MILPPHNRGNSNATQWKRIDPLLPPQKFIVGRPTKDHRTTVNDILWILRTGAPWQDLPQSYGLWQTVSGRIYRWRKQGIWQMLLESLQQQAEAEGQINWQINFVNVSVIRAHQHAAGEGASDPEATGPLKKEISLPLGREPGNQTQKEEQTVVLVQLSLFDDLLRESGSIVQST